MSEGLSFRISACVGHHQWLAGSVRSRKQCRATAQLLPGEVGLGCLLKGCWLIGPVEQDAVRLSWACLGERANHTHVSTLPLVLNALRSGRASCSVLPSPHF